MHLKKQITVCVASHAASDPCGGGSTNNGSARACLMVPVPLYAVGAHLPILAGIASSVLAQVVCAFLGG